jgi:hypothetical protein
LKSRYLLFFSSRGVSRHAGTDVKAGDTYGFYFACFKDLLSFRPVLSDSRLILYKRIATDDVIMHWLYHFH